MAGEKGGKNPSIEGSSESDDVSILYGWTDIRNIGWHMASVLVI
tara:strand:- start:2477 stop:2608 length:132 start_codon:yes stop_codon:yes gene_type:complete